MSYLVFLRSASATRPPALDPRLRRIDPAVERRLERWVRNILQLRLDTPLTFTEWVALDSRAVPHTLFIRAGAGREQRSFVIERASERIAELDLREALWPLDPQLHAGEI